MSRGSARELDKALADGAGEDEEEGSWRQLRKGIDAPGP